MKNLYINFICILLICISHLTLQGPTTEEYSFSQTNFLFQPSTSNVYLESETDTSQLRVREDGSLQAFQLITKKTSVTSPPISSSCGKMVASCYSDPNQEKNFLTNQPIDLTKKKQLYLTLGARSDDCPILVDPLKYSSFFGGTQNDIVTDFYLSSYSLDFSIVFVGTTTSPDLPKFGGLSNIALPQADQQQRLMFLTSFDVSGGILVSTYFGGIIGKNKSAESQFIIPRQIIRSTRSSFWVVGSTNMNSLPMSVNSFEGSLLEKETGFILHLNKDCDSILYSTLFGGDSKNSVTRLMSIGQDRWNQYIFVAGITNSTSSSMYKNSLQPIDSFNEKSKFSIYFGAIETFSDSSSLLFGTVIGGTDTDILQSMSLAMITQGQEYSCWLAGKTKSMDFFDYYNHTISPDVTLVNNNKENSDNYTAFFLNIEITDQATTPNLLAGGFLSFPYDESIIHITHDYSRETREKTIASSHITICGYTRNWDTFGSMNDSVVKPDWVTEKMIETGGDKNDGVGNKKMNNGNTEVGFVARINPNGTLIEFAFLFGCENGITRLTFNSPNITDVFAVSGFSNCQNKLQMNYNIWDHISPKDYTIDDYEFKYFVLKINSTTIINNSFQNDPENVVFSSYIDGVSFPIMNNDGNGNDNNNNNNNNNFEGKDYNLDDIPNGVIIGNSGNIYMVKTIYQSDYYPEQIPITQNSILDNGYGNSTVIFRVYTGFNCHPGSFLKTTNESIDVSSYKLCYPALSGSYSVGFNSEESILCESGAYQNQVGTTSCLKCKNDTYSITGQSECVKSGINPAPRVWITSVGTENMVVEWTLGEIEPFVIISNNGNDNVNSKEEDVGGKDLIENNNALNNYHFLNNPLNNDDRGILNDNGINNLYFNVKITSPRLFVYYLLLNASSLELNNNKFHYSFEKLIPTTRYYITIRSFTLSPTKKISSWSQESSCLTLPYPYRVSYNSIQLEPGYNYINVTWGKPFEIEDDPIIQYFISYYKENEITNHKHVITTNTNTMITDLELGKRYHVAVLATNKAGQGPQSLFKVTKTQMQIPTMIEIKQSIPAPNSILLNFNPPNERGSTIDKYKYEIISPIKKSEIIPINKVTSSKNFKEITITGLESHTTYKVSIFAHNSIGWSDSYYFEFSTNKKSFWDMILIIVVIVLLLIIILIILIQKNLLFRKKRKSKIKKLIKDQKLKFEKLFLNSLHPTGETLIFNQIEERKIHDLLLDIDSGKCVKLGSKSYVLLNTKSKNELFFCKETIEFEETIYRGIWKQFLVKPQKIPFIKFIGSSDLLNTTTQTTNSIRNHNYQIHDEKNWLLNSNNNNNNNNILSDTDTDSDFDSKFDLDNNNNNNNSIIIGNDEDENKLDNNSNDNNNTRFIRKKKIIALEYLPYNLDEYIIKRKEDDIPFTDKEKVFIAYNLFTCLLFLHKNGIIHRDIKPRNIIIGFDGYLRIVDFDTAILLLKGQSQFRDAFVGTHEFFDPFCRYSFDEERGEANYTYTAANDIYALGKTLQKIDYMISDSEIEIEIAKIFGVNELPPKKKKIEKSKIDIEISEKEDKEFSPLTKIISLCLSSLEIRPSLEELLNMVNNLFDY
ncbi:membrane-associated tyrosine- and threonine-specific cdc2-inhibitory kinase [Anaeramoeba flamelloides]|uniref:Membrane-associated tyrosine- and threonine-specific cdc2-inhibitory kinase n=1 Tax=Anaeramoeba flamelloides TaxID=1746091 RepID=A0ABQ8YA49_9EUKA|nr:membrane-associated tyrosine- and threonine-specific cdc2-inhibitory kinase [Anaeramoeba flamelloides]